MAKYQIEATIEKLEQGGIQLKGTTKYLFEKKKDEEYWNILEASNPKDSKLVVIQENFQIDIPKNELGIQHLLGYAFAEKKKLKFELDEKYTITAISNAST